MVYLGTVTFLCFSVYELRSLYFALFNRCFGRTVGLLRRKITIYEVIFFNQEFIIYSRECLTAYTCIKRTALTTKSTPFSVNKVSASICYSTSIFNSSKTHVTLNLIS